MKLSLLRNEDGASVVEFGLLLPVIFGSFLGVLQAGLGMMTYNSLRNLTAETSRYTLVEYQSSNEITHEQIKANGASRAKGHGLAPDRFSIAVTQPETQRIEGAIELEIVTTYKVQSVLPFLGINDFNVSFSRPIFLIDEVDNSEDGSELDEGEEGTGTDFGEGGLEEVVDDVIDKNCELVESNCDHDHKEEDPVVDGDDGFVP